MRLEATAKQRPVFTKKFQGLIFIDTPLPIPPLWRPGKTRAGEYGALERVELELRIPRELVVLAVLAKHLPDLRDAARLVTDDHAVNVIGAGVMVAEMRAKRGASNLPRLENQQADRHPLRPQILVCLVDPHLEDVWHRRLSLVVLVLDSDHRTEMHDGRSLNQRDDLFIGDAVGVERLVVLEFPLMP